MKKITQKELQTAIDVLRALRDALAYPQEFQFRRSPSERRADEIQEFLKSHCLSDPRAAVQSNLLYESFRSWYRGRNGGVKPPCRLTFEKSAAATGLTKKRRGRRSFYIGINLKSSEVN